MDLSEFWKIFRRRWVIAIIPAIIVLAWGVATYQPVPMAYNAGVRFIVGQPPGSAATDADEQRYYNWLTSEYIVNGLTDWVRGGKFAEAVSKYLATQGHDVPAGAIQGGIAADNTRSMMTVSVTAGDPDQLAQILDGAIVILTEDNAAALPQLGGETAVLTQLDEPIISPIAAGIRSQLDLPLRVALALAVGLGLALLAHYLDPTIRERAEIEKIGLSIIGEIPREGRRR